LQFALLEEYTYGTSRERLKKEGGGTRTYYAWGGESVILEYPETGSSTTPSWSKSYIYAGSRLLSTITKSGSTELTEYQHPDRLGTKLITDTTLNTAKEQATLPFGTEIPAETAATSNQRFTSYDRSTTTGLDYAVNRTYNSGQSRFTQVDPIGMGDSSLGDPQSLNLFAYTRNNPVDFVDPSGLNLSSGISSGFCPPEYNYVTCQALNAASGNPIGGGGGGGPAGTLTIGAVFRLGYNGADGYGLVYTYAYKPSSAPLILSDYKK